jgi:hypothetical protein
MSEFSAPLDRFEALYGRRATQHVLMCARERASHAAPSVQDLRDAVEDYIRTLRQTTAAAHDSTSSLEITSEPLPLSDVIGD